MYWSAGLVALVPPGVVTVMSTVPAVPAGAVAVIWVALSRVNDLAALAPKSTAVAPVKSLPDITTEVPPAPGPPDGLSARTTGAGAAQIAIEPIIPPPVLAVSTLHVVLLTVKPPAGSGTTGASTDGVGASRRHPSPGSRSGTGQTRFPGGELWASCSE